jgi:hypothetical protein
MINSRAVRNLSKCLSVRAIPIGTQQWLPTGWILIPEVVHCFAEHTSVMTCDGQVLRVANSVHVSLQNGQKYPLVARDMTDFHVTLTIYSTLKEVQESD